MVPIGCMGNFFGEEGFVASHWPKLLVLLLEAALGRCHRSLSLLILIITQRL